ncbi:ribonuclease HII [Rubrobacter marinus]|uniref:Ribonuclease n=1 Tax=Rubrobacter marinus TaxID=2653852 RepID=A0A6G8PXJ4_9ACTN|nr:ribonuclease HII [Rubrobacter marinus]QIN78939.1 ribonuclease HII [Rubrobacter marinus]
MPEPKRGRRREDPSGALYAFDAAFVSGGRGPLAGADEAGRGALAGPIVAAAVILGEEKLAGLDDSKALGEGVREALFRRVVADARALSVVSFPAWWIDEHGVGRANREALSRALGSVSPYSGRALADGTPKLGPAVECMPRADGKSAAVAAASVVAKVLRDHAMRMLELEHPGYGFDRNRGYGTLEHRSSLREVGPCAVHRLSYAGVGAS